MSELFRAESGKVLATVVRLVGSVDVAEEILQDVMLTALERWPEQGVPDKPGAWIMTAARHRALDVLRSRKTARSAEDAIAEHEELLRAPAAPDDETRIDTGLGDDPLRLVFTCCHPVLPREAQVALTLRLVAGLSTEDIARAFLAAEPTIAQRIVRAKRALTDAGIPYEVPGAEELPDRLPAVLEVVYLVFNEGYTARAGDSLLRIDLHVEAIRLATSVAELLPAEPEPLGLLALLELQASRHATRAGPDGELVRLADQDRSRWDAKLVARGLEHLERAEALGRSIRAAAGPYVLQAAIAACHARAARWQDTDWDAIVRGYDALLEQTGSPVVALNRVVAIAERDGAEAALGALDTIDGLALLEGYHLLHATRGELLLRLARWDDATRAFTLARSLTENERERAHLDRRIAEAGRAT